MKRRYETLATTPSIHSRASKVRRLDSREWHSASSVHNYMLNDPIIDWLKFKDRAATPSRDPFVNFIMNQGIVFESHVLRYLTSKVGTENIARVCSNVEDVLSASRYEETIDAMRRGVYLIYQGTLHNATNNTYGSPDFIVRSDIINHLVDVPALSTDECMIPAPALSPHQFHYRIIDVKFTTLKLRADGKHLLNSGRAACNKAQVMIYNAALGHAQGYTPPACYIMGRGYTYKSKGIEYSSRKLDARLGQIDVSGIDQQYNGRINSALDWLRDLKSEGSRWQVTPIPSRRELYPNMCNRYDAPFRDVKLKYAEELDDITLLWQCGPTQRNNCAAHGVTRWTDPRCSADMLGFTGERIRTIVQRMLDFNHGKLGDAKVIPEFVQNNYRNWRSRDSNGSSIVPELFIDFENVTNVIDDMQSIPNASQLHMVFMIGVGWMQNNQWNYKCFIARQLNEESEVEIFQQFDEFITTIARDYFQCDPAEINLIHWGHVEQSLYETAAARAYARGISISATRNFVDMHRVFKSEIILVRGVLDFGLKSVACGLVEHNLITLRRDTSNISNGLDAMTTAIEHYSSRDGNLPQMQKIIDYNELDCEMVQQIVHYLRTNHSNDHRLGTTLRNYIARAIEWFPPWLKRTFGPF